MNVLECYIKNVYSITDVTDSCTWYEGDDPMFLIHLKYDCYGDRHDRTMCFTAGEWEEVKQRGYFMA